MATEEPASVAEPQLERPAPDLVAEEPLLDSAPAGPVTADLPVVAPPTPEGWPADLAELLYPPRDAVPPAQPSAAEPEPEPQLESGPLDGQALRAEAGSGVDEVLPVPDDPEPGDAAERNNRAQ